MTCVNISESNLQCNYFSSRCVVSKIWKPISVIKPIPFHGLYIFSTNDNNKNYFCVRCTTCLSCVPIDGFSCK